MVIARYWGGSEKKEGYVQAIARDYRIMPVLLVLEILKRVRVILIPAFCSPKPLGGRKGR